MLMPATVYGTVGDAIVHCEVAGFTLDGSSRRDYTISTFCGYVAASHGACYCTTLSAC